MRVPDGISPVRAYRTWCVLATDSGPRLMSGIKGFDMWEPGAPLRARCSHARDAHRSPSWTCTCGIYASKRPDARRPYGWVAGEVAMWGRVIEHAHGYRAEFARPSALLPRGLGVDVPRLATIYDLPVVDLEAAAS